MQLTVVLSALLGAVNAFVTVAPTTTNKAPTETVSSIPIDLSKVTASDSLNETLILSLNNLLSRNRAQKCDGLDKDVFIELAYKFLSDWKTEDYEHERNGHNQTERDLLVRLVEYQSVYQTMLTQSQQDAFPDDIIDHIRSIHTMATAEGALRGDNDRVLDALNVIFDDVCGDTKNAKVPHRVREINDIVLRGLTQNLENTAF